MSEVVLTEVMRRCVQNEFHREQGPGEERGLVTKRLLKARIKDLTRDRNIHL